MKRKNTKFKIINICYILLSILAITSSIISAILFIYYDKYNGLAEQISSVFNKNGFSSDQIDNITKSMMIDNSTSIYGLSQIKTMLIVFIVITIVSIILILILYVINKIKRKRKEKENE